MKDWSDPWLQDGKDQADHKKRSVLREIRESDDSGGAVGSGIVRDETTPAQPPLADADIEANAQAMSKIKGQKNFRSIRGNLMEKNLDVPRRTDVNTQFQ